MGTEGRWIDERRARRTLAAWFRGSGLAAFLALASATASAGAPPEYSAGHLNPNATSYSCAFCHGGPPAPISGSQIVVQGATAATASDLRGIMAGAGTMGVILDPADTPPLTDNDLEAIRLYLIAVRDGRITGASGNFGNVVVTANSGTQAFTITNERAVAATFAVAPSASGDFSIASTTCGGSVGAQSTCTVNVRFTPSALGPRNGALTFTFAVDGDLVTTAQVSQPLSGTGTTQFQISSTNLDFGSVVATTTATRQSVISNLGGNSFQITALTFGGANPALYSLGPANTCTVGLSVVAGANCVLDVKFAPLVAGANQDATLLVSQNAVGASNPLVTLHGSASPAPVSHIILSSTSLAFPDTQVGSNAVLPAITVQNDGTASLNFNAFTFGGAAPGDYQRSGTCTVGTPVPVGNSCTVIVTFQPTALGGRSASLTITSDASNGPAVITLTGNGVPVPAPVATLVPISLDFGQQTVGGLYPSRRVTLQNTGTANMTVTSVTVNGATFANVSAAPCPPTLVPGANCAIDITFTPVAANTDYAGTLSIVTNAPGSPHTVPLTGHGTATAVPVLAWVGNPASLDLGTTAAGTISAPQTATLVNNGPGGVTLGLINIVGVDASVFVINGGTCAAGLVLFQGDSCTVTIVFSPAISGVRNAQVQVASSGSAPPTLALTGTGLGGPNPGLALSTATLQFADTRVGSSSVPLELTLSGSGSGVVSVSALAVTGPYTMQTKTCPAVPFALQVGSSCVVTVTFKPQAEGASAGTLSVTSDAQPNVQDVALNGNGAAPPDVSGGGCSIATGATVGDPTLWLLAALAVVALVVRRRPRARHGRDDNA
jgi:MYXO-CTERM domain-containing protein